MGRKEITQGLRQDAVHLVLTEGRSVRQVCEMLGVGPTAVRRWVANHQTAGGEAQSQQGVSPSSRDSQRVVELETELRRVREERDLLKKSIAFFVRESDHQRR